MSTNPIAHDASQAKLAKMAVREAAAEADSKNGADADAELKSIISEILGVDPQDAAQFDANTGLFGHLPELDSMAVAGLLTEIEDRLGFVIEDDEVDGEMLETYGALLTFVETKLVEAKPPENKPVEG